MRRVPLDDLSRDEPIAKNVKFRNAIKYFTESARWSHALIDRINDDADYGLGAHAPGRHRGDVHRCFF